MHPIWMVIKCHLWLSVFACDFSHQLGTIYFGKWCCLPLRIQRRTILVNKSVFFLFQWLATPSIKDTKTTKPFKQPPAIISNLINNLDSCDLLSTKRKTELVPAYPCIQLIIIHNLCIKYSWVANSDLLFLATPGAFPLAAGITGVLFLDRTPSRASALSTWAQVAPPWNYRPFRPWK